MPRARFLNYTNHIAWLDEIGDADENDIYPEVRGRTLNILEHPEYYSDFNDL